MARSVVEFHASSAHVYVGSGLADTQNHAGEARPHQAARQVVCGYRGDAEGSE